MRPQTPLKVSGLEVHACKMSKGEIKEIEGGLMCEATDTFFECVWA